MEHVAEQKPTVFADRRRPSLDGRSNGVERRQFSDAGTFGNPDAMELAEAVEMRPQAVSNQLQRLVDRGILTSRREGSNICYRIDDPCVEVLLERGLCLIECCPEEK